MRLTQSIVAISLASLTAAAYGSQLTARRTAEEAAQGVTDKYIIELAQGIDFDTAAKELSSQSGIKVLKNLQSAVFNGISIQASKSSQESLQALPHIARAWPSRRIQLQENQQMSTFSDGAEAGNYSLHSMTGVDKIHASGVFGKGAKVAIIDTGVDYNHPVLGGGFGPGFKVAGGYDLVGDGAWPGAEKVPDSDPLDQIGRGTHAAGVVAGKGDWFTGVAPEATILAYKVFTNNDYTDDETIIEAFIRAYEDGADVISATFGEYDGWSTGAFATIASRIVDEGVVVAVAAGNSGQWGPFHGTSGANGENVLAVASADPTFITGLPIQATLTNSTSTDTKTFAYRPGPFKFTSDIQGIPIHPLSLDPKVEDDACGTLPQDTPDLSDKIVLVRISTKCMDSEQINNIRPYKPLGILFYHNAAKMFFNPWTDTYRGPTGIIIPEAGELIVNTIASGGKVSFNASQVDSGQYVNLPYYYDAGAPSLFTSWGATWDLKLKPDIAAPGAEVMGPFPTWKGSWQVMGGTFCAAPYVAGVAALYVSKHGGRAQHGKGFGKMLSARITASGSAMPWPGKVTDGGKHLASPMQVGTGLVDARKVMGYTTQLSLERFNLNDTHQFSRYHGVDITNNGDEEVVYSFAVQDAGGFDAFAGENAMTNQEELTMYKLKPEVRFPAGTFKVKPGQTKKAEFIFKMPELPSGHVGAKMPIVSGKILITSSNGEELSVPYLGVVSDLKKEMRAGTMWKSSQMSPRVPEIVTGVKGGTVQYIWDKPYWGFNTSAPTQDYPLLNAMLTYGAKELRWDIFEKGWKERKWQYPPVVGQNGFIGSVSYWRYSEYLATGPLYPDDDINDVVPTPSEDLQRSYPHLYAWFGQLSNGSMIAPGNYTMRLAVLLPFGNHEASDNWDVAEMPEIMILPRGK